MRFLLVVATVALGACSTCVDKGAGPQGKKIEALYVADRLLESVPPEVEHLDVDLGGKVTYVGNTVDIPRIVPGQLMHVTHYWQVKAPPGKGWRVFAFLRGDPGTADFMNLPATDMELGLPVEKWQAGQIIKDPLDIVLRPDWKSSTATLYVGLIQVGGHDVNERMAATGAHTTDRAVVARVMPIDLSRAPPPPGTIHIPHANSPINVDGNMTELAWSQTAAVSPEFVTADNSPDPSGRATARITWDEQNLYVFVQVYDADITSPFKNHDESLWKWDDIEMFIDADANQRTYVELQVNPNNATFDSYFATRAQGDPSWDSGMVTAVQVRKPADQPGGEWDAEVAIPWQAVKGRDTTSTVRLPPQVGDRWRLNVVRVDVRASGGNPSASSWNRIGYGDWHALDRMLTAVFADSTGVIVPSATPPAGQGSGAGSAAGSAAAPPPPVVPMIPAPGSAAKAP